MILLIKIQFFFLLASFLSLPWLNLNQFLGLFFGLLLMLLNLLLFQFLGGGAKQKFIALKTPLVVLKYAIWSLFIYGIINFLSINIEFFVLGLGLWILTLLVYAMILHNNFKKEQKWQHL